MLPSHHTGIMTKLLNNDYLRFSQLWNKLKTLPGLATFLNKLLLYVVCGRPVM